MRTRIQTHVRIIVGVATGVIIALAVLLLHTHNEAISLVKEQFNDQQMLVARQTSIGIEQNMNILVRELKLLSRMNAIRDMDLKGARNIMEEFFEYVKTLYVNDIALIDSKGLCMLPLMAPHLEGTDFSYREYFKKASALKMSIPAYEFIMFKGVDIGAKGIVIAMPVFSRNGEFAGVVLFTIKVSELIAGFVPEQSTDGGTWLIDSYGKALYHQEYEPGTIIEEIPGLDATLTAFLDTLKSGEPRKAEYVAPGSIKKVASSYPVKVADQTWSLVIATPERTVSKLLTSFSTDYLFATSIAVVTIFFALVVVNRWNVHLKREIEEHKKTEEALRESETRYVEMFENMSNGAAVYEAMDDGENFVFVGFNKAAEKIENLKRENLMGKSVVDVFPGVKDFGLFEAFQRVWATGKPEHHPITMYHDERVLGWRENYVYKLPSGEVVALYSDETKRKQAEEATKVAYAELNQIFQTAGGGMRVVDKHFNVLRVNETFATLSGVLEAQGVGKKCFEGFPGHACHTNQCPLSRILGGEERVEYEAEKVRSDGAKIPCIITATPFRRPDGELIGIVQDFKDISERKQAEKVLKEAHDKLEQRVEERTAELVSTNKQLMEEVEARKNAEGRVRALSQQLIKAQESERQKLSHDLHDDLAQNLSAAKIGVDSFLDDELGPLSEKKESFAEVSDLLYRSISAVREMAYNLRPASLDQLGLAQAVREHCEEFAKKNGVEVDFFSAGADESKLDVDTKISLYRLIQESLNNIQKHADANHVTVRLVASFPNIILRIEDDGKGFDVQERLIATLNEKRMGLRSMEERISLLQGEMRIESRLMQGTKIIIEVPCEEKEDEKQEDHLDS